MTATLTATPTLIRRTGEWGARISGTANVGDTVTVTARSGKTWTARVADIVWAGNGVTVAATSKIAGADSTDDDAPAVPAAGLEPGVYESSDGIFVVKPNRAKTRLYAKRLVEINADRLNEDGGRVQVEFEYAPGAVLRLTPGDRMDAERAKELTIRYGRCIVCGAHLKAAKSVERGIGPVCAKAFA